MKFLILVSLYLLLACSHMDRHQDSGYAATPAKRHNYTTTSPSKILSSKTVALELDEKTMLKKLESSLSTKKEIEQYSKALPWFKNEQEKIEFLSINGFEEKQKWMKKNDFSARPQSTQTQLAEVIEAQDIAVGMPENLVRRSWGEPDGVEVSGHPQFRNFRWRYQKFISTPNGYKSERKIVYFEGGKVIGWEVE